MEEFDVGEVSFWYMKYFFKSMTALNELIKLMEDYNFDENDIMQVAIARDTMREMLREVLKKWREEVKHNETGRA